MVVMRLLVKLKVECSSSRVSMMAESNSKWLKAGNLEWGVVVESSKKLIAESLIHWFEVGNLEQLLTNLNLRSAKVIISLWFRLPVNYQNRDLEEHCLNPSFVAVRYLSFVLRLLFHDQCQVIDCWIFLILWYSGL
jgi:hypothetical protein